MRVALYARVSTQDQDPEVQLAALRAHAAQRGWASLTRLWIVGTRERAKSAPPWIAS
jgi:DNA invertase Pin-like site-specific DNA recombinase